MGPPKKYRKQPIQGYPKLNLERILGHFRNLENLERAQFLVALNGLIETWPVHEENLSKISKDISRYAAHTYLQGAISQMRRTTKEAFQSLGIRLENKDLKSLLGGNTQKNLQSIYDSCKSEPTNLSGRFVSRGSKLIQ